MQLLLDFGSSAVDKLGKTLLHKAAARNISEIKEILITHDAQVMACNEESNTPLVEEVNNLGKTALHLATKENSNSQIIRMLLVYAALAAEGDFKSKTKTHKLFNCYLDVALPS
jgi:ankyrin repeat protein